MRLIVVASLCSVGMLAVACSSSNGQPAVAPSPTVSSKPSVAPKPSHVSVGQADNGRRITVGNQSTVVVRLASTYWHFEPTDAAGALRQVRVNTHTNSDGIPGSGRGTVVAVYRAVSTGTAVVGASRTSCGEAMRCTPAQSRFRLTVVVR